jgi:hypothetical protein
MGRAADVYRSTPHDDLRSFGEGNSEVKEIRRLTGALHRQTRGNKTRGSTISQDVARRFAVAGWVTSGAGSSRDDRKDSAWPSPDDRVGPAGPGILRLR